MSFPNRVLGWRSLPTVVIVIKPHLCKKTFSCSSCILYFYLYLNLYILLLLVIVIKPHFYLALTFSNMPRWKSRSSWPLSCDCILYLHLYFYLWSPEGLNESPGVAGVVHHVHFLVGEVPNPARAVHILLEPRSLCSEFVKIPNLGKPCNKKNGKKMWHCPLSATPPLPKRVKRGYLLSEK